MGYRNPQRELRPRMLHPNKDTAQEEGKKTSDVKTWPSKGDVVMHNGVHCKVMSSANPRSQRIRVRREGEKFGFMAKREDLSPP